MSLSGVGQRPSSKIRQEAVGQSRRGEDGHLKTCSLVEVREGNTGCQSDVCIVLYVTSYSSAAELMDLPT